MPVVYKDINGESTLLLWRIDETEEQLYEEVDHADFLSSARFDNGRRRREHLAWRAAFRTVLPDAEVGYDDNGAPYIVGGRMFVSAGHTRNMAAVLLSDKKCAVDIEDMERDFSKASCRYITAHEEQLHESHKKDFMAAMWCAKEALYKYSGRKGLNLRDDISITDTDMGNCLMTGRIGQTDGIEIRILRWGSYMTAYII